MIGLAREACNSKTLSPSNAENWWQALHSWDANHCLRRVGIPYLTKEDILASLSFAATRERMMAAVQS
jgi:hypothetical protein